jgi:N-acetyl-gamma-glutamyl-phosphate reductase
MNRCKWPFAVQERTHVVGLVGATGYTGQVFHALLMHHPCVTSRIVEARTPDDLGPDGLEILARCDAVALALPSDAAATWTDALWGAGARRILDLSDQKRLEVHYGLPELFGPPPADARVVANPGCYPTATLLALLPLMRAGRCERDGIAVVGASGASGAGKSLAEHLHFCNLAENVFPYKVGEHRHVPEIEHHLGAPISFVTELLPIVRGLIVTAFVRPTAPPAALLDTLRETYAGSPWVTVLDHAGQTLGLRHVVGTHQALVAVGPVARSGLVPVFCSIDNLMRGAASQALHNLNLWLGLPEGAGLPPPLRPRAGLPDAVAIMTSAAFLPVSPEVAS